jgi:hypothetical protein
MSNIHALIVYITLQLLLGYRINDEFSTNFCSSGRYQEIQFQIGGIILPFIGLFRSLRKIALKGYYS